MKDRIGVVQPHEVSLWSTVYANSLAREMRGYWFISDDERTICRLNAALEADEAVIMLRGRVPQGVAG